jgi:hypothetical protein
MSEYNTLNPVPSFDPRDLDDNATVFDRLLHDEAPTVNDRLGVPRKTWWQVEIDAQALVSPNVSALAGLTGSANKAPYFTGAGAMSLMTVSPAARTLLDDATVGDMLVTLGGAPVASPTFTGDPKAPTPAPGDNDTSIATTAFVNNAVSSKADLASPTFTGDPKAPTPTVTDSDTSIATTAFVESKIAQKRTWTSYTPTLSLTSGAYTSANVSGKYMVAFGICHVQITLLVTTKGTGAFPILTLPMAALAGSVDMPLLAVEVPLAGVMGRATIRSDLASVLIGGAGATDLVTGNGAKVTINGSYPIA